MPLAVASCTASPRTAVPAARWRSPRPARRWRPAAPDSPHGRWRPAARRGPGRGPAGRRGWRLPRGGRVLVTADGRVGTLRVWDTAADRPEARLTLMGPMRIVDSVAFAAGGRAIAVGGHDGAVRVWELATGLLAATLAGHAGPVTGLAESADGRLLASVGSDGTGMVWDLTRVRRLADPPAWFDTPAASAEALRP